MTLQVFQALVHTNKHFSTRYKQILYNHGDIVVVVAQRPGVLAQGLTDRGVVDHL